MNLDTKQFKGNTELITTYKGIYLRSYNVIIAFCDIYDNIFLDEVYWKFSATTNKHRCRFLEESGKETNKKIKSGEYKLKNLN